MKSVEISFHSSLFLNEHQSKWFCLSDKFWSNFLVENIEPVIRSTIWIFQKGKCRWFFRVVNCFFFTQIFNEWKFQYEAMSLLTLEHVVVVENSEIKNLLRLQPFDRFHCYKYKHTIFHQLVRLREMNIEHFYDCQLTNTNQCVQCTPFNCVQKRNRTISNE